MKFKHLYISAMCVLLFGAVQAQHNGVMGQYMFNGLVINPAYAGNDQVLMLNLNTRQQWVGFEGNPPSSQIISGHKQVKRKKIAFGGLLSVDRIGVFKEVALTGTFAYRLKVGEGKLSLGLGAGIAQTSAAYSSLANKVYDTGDVLLQNNDPGFIRPEFSFGIRYKTDDYYIGYSSPSLTGYSYAGDTTGLAKAQISFNMNHLPHLITGGYDFTINKNLQLKPSFLFSYSPFASPLLDLNTNAWYKDTYGVGVSYRHQNAIVFLAELKASFKLKFGYAYESGLSDLRQLGGSHELVVEYAIGKFEKTMSARDF